MSFKNSTLSKINSLYPEFKHVSISEDKIPNLVNNLDFAKSNHWDFDFIYKDGGEKSLIYLALFSCISYCYWDSPKWHKIYNGQVLWGSYALFYALKDAIDNGKNIFDPHYLSKINQATFENILKGEENSVISHIEERYEITRKFGETLVSKFHGNFTELLTKSNYDAETLHAILVNEFDILNDVHLYKGVSVGFYKKSQEIITLIFEQFKGQGLGNIKNMDKLMASSDYKLPQILNYYGVLRYSNELLAKIENKFEFNDLDDVTLEIRMATILICNKISEFINSHFKTNVREFEISNLLWTLSQSPTAIPTPSPRIKSSWV